MKDDILIKFEKEILSQPPCKDREDALAFIEQERAREAEEARKKLSGEHKLPSITEQLEVAQLQAASPMRDELIRMLSQLKKRNIEPIEKITKFSSFTFKLKGIFFTLFCFTLGASAFYLAVHEWLTGPVIIKNQATAASSNSSIFYGNIVFGLIIGSACLIRAFIIIVKTFTASASEQLMLTQDRDRHNPFARISLPFAFAGILLLGLMTCIAVAALYKLFFS